MDKERFKELLDSGHTWPCLYTFKFIVSRDHVDRVLELFPDELPTVRNSAKASFVAVTFNVTMASSDDVLRIYDRASQIEGIISL